MENKEGQIDLMTFDLGENNGGRQLILTHKSVSSTEHYVFTIGDGPQEDKLEEKTSGTAEQESTGIKKLFSKNAFSNLRDHLVHKKTEEKKEVENNIKLRCFKLSLAENGKYLVKEYRDPAQVEEVAKLFNL